MPGIVTTITPPATTALTTAANVILDLNLTGTPDTTYLNLLIERASAAVANYIGHKLGLQTLSEAFRHSYGQPYVYNPFPPGYGQQAERVHGLVLSHAPIVSITSIVEDGSTLTAGVDYEYEPNAALIWRLTSGNRIGWYGQTTTVVYQAGWVLPQDTGTRTLPTEIEDVVLAMLRATYFQRGTDPNLVLELTEGVGRMAYNPTATTASTVLTANAHLLNSYRHFVW